MMMLPPLLVSSPPWSRLLLLLSCRLRSRLLWWLWCRLLHCLAGSLLLLLLLLLLFGKLPVVLKPKAEQQRLANDKRLGFGQVEPLTAGTLKNLQASQQCRQLLY
jgi:hypothetical protein